MSWETEYKRLLRRVINDGVDRNDRTGTGTIALFGETLRVDLTEGFPMLTLRKLSFPTVVAEALWYLKGEGNTKFLKEHGINIWDAWANEKGELGPVYGVQWRKWPISGEKLIHEEDTCIDQVDEVIFNLNHSPNSRRLLVSAWNVAQLKDMALPPCPFAWQIHQANKKLHMTVYQRSADLIVGLPHDVAVHALLLCMIASVTGNRPATLNFMIGDAHLYLDHVDVAKQILLRPSMLSPLLFFASKKNIDDYEPDDFELRGYDAHPRIKVRVAV